MTEFKDISLTFMRAVRLMYGNKKLNEVAKAIHSILEDDFKDIILYDVLSDQENNTSGSYVVIYGIGPEKVKTIKAIRTLTGMDLAPAHKIIKLDVTADPYFLDVTLYDPELVLQFIYNMHSLGNKVKLI